ncbi:hypothetical protein [Sphingopyxis granuli]|nr:hypothetical protein [Sphingopyxis granuli]
MLYRLPIGQADMCSVWITSCNRIRPYRRRASGCRCIRHWQDYLDWAVECFRISASGVQPHTQVHTGTAWAQLIIVASIVATLRINGNFQIIQHVKGEFGYSRKVSMPKGEELLQSNGTKHDR